MWQLFKFENRQYIAVGNLTTWGRCYGRWERLSQFDPDSRYAIGRP